MISKINKLIKLDKPLIFFDLETTGLAISADRIIEIAYVKIMPNGITLSGDIFLNPQADISKESSEIHGMTNADLRDKPTFKQKAQEIWEIFNNCYYAGFNIMNFDLPMLRREFLRVGMDFDYAQSKIIDSKIIFHFMEPRTLSAAYKFYCNKEHKKAHSALADIQATVKILNKQLVKYKEARDWDFIYKIHHLSDDRYVDNERKFYWRNGQAYFTFSKYRDTALEEVVKKDPEFLEWILSAGFSEETKNIVKKALQGELPKKNLNRD